MPQGFGGGKHGTLYTHSARQVIGNVMAEWTEVLINTRSEVHEKVFN